MGEPARISCVGCERLRRQGINPKGCQVCEARRRKPADPKRPSCPFCGAHYANGFVQRIGFSGEYACETTAFATSGHHRSKRCKDRQRQQERAALPWWRRWRG